VNVLLRAALVLGALVAFAVPAHADGPVGTALAVGLPAPNFDLRTADGGRVRLADFRGRTLVINAWATWCPPCREETPDVLEAYKQLHAPRVAFLGVDSSEDAALVRTFVAARGIAWQEALDSERSFSRAYGVQFIPTTFVIDPNGIVRARFVDLITPALLRSFIGSAQAGRNVELTSAVQAKIDALLDPARYSFARGPGLRLQVQAAVGAASAADDLANNGTDPQKGEIADLVRTHGEEAALLDRAVAAFAPLATLPADRALLAHAQGDAATAQLRWRDAIAAYRRALSVDPANRTLLEALAYAAQSANDDVTGIAADRRLVELTPGTGPLLDLAVAYSRAKQYPNAEGTFARAVSAGEAGLRAASGSQGITLLANVHLYYGRTLIKESKGARAQREFAAVSALAGRLPQGDPKAAMLLEEAQEATVALTVRAARTALSVAPWTGPDLPGSVTSTFKYRLIVSGRGGRALALHTEGLPKDWIASFCSDRVCAPFKTTLQLPASGVKVVEFQVIPPDEKIRALKPVRIVARDEAGGRSIEATIQ
jgi:peroxiredoxin/tetratricopeptide (TPR) repeat protein